MISTKNISKISSFLPQSLTLWQNCIIMGKIFSVSGEIMKKIIVLCLLLVMTAAIPMQAEASAESGPRYSFTEEEKQMLLKIGMAELGGSGCPECIALVMRTILNRVEADRFGSSVRSVLFAPEQFTPVLDGSYYDAVPNENCYDAYEMVLYGWDESQGALYYEFCEGESWHSKNLNLLFQHCDTRFYN